MPVFADQALKLNRRMMRQATNRDALMPIDGRRRRAR
jgi:hypothetical protein